MHDLNAIVTEILRDYALPLRGDHGVSHWARVLENGRRIADRTGADEEVVSLFAVFHDARRVNEGRDRDHGLRGGRLAQSLRGSLVHLDEARFSLLFEACRLHSDGLIESDLTLAACWDADRLDLGRVGTRPMPHLMCTDVARELIPWAFRRSVQRYEPAELLAAWGLARA